MENYFNLVYDVSLVATPSHPALTHQLTQTSDQTQSNIHWCNHLLSKSTLYSNQIKGLDHTHHTPHTNTHTHMTHVGDNDLDLLYLQPKPLPQRKRRRQQLTANNESKSESVNVEEEASSSSASSVISSPNEIPNNEAEEFFVISTLSVQEINNLRTTTTTTKTTNIMYHIMDENYEFLDHTADVLVHAHGTSIPSTLSNAVLAMNCYMIDRPENVHFTHSCEIHGI